MLICCFMRLIIADEVVRSHGLIRNNLCRVMPARAPAAHVHNPGRSYFGGASPAQIEAARQRLEQVLETYTDLTRFPK